MSFFPYKYIPALFIFISSCTTAKIELSNPIPALHDLGRGADVSVIYDGWLAGAAGDALKLKLRESDYYNVVSGASSYIISLKDTYTCEGCNTVNGVILRVYQTRPLHKLVFEKNIRLISEQIWGELPAETRVLRDCYNALVPHKQKFKVRVKPSTPELDLAIKSCQNEQWGNAQEIAQQAISKHPHDAEGYYLMAIIEHHKSNYIAACNLLTQASKLMSDDRYAQAMFYAKQAAKNSTPSK